MNKICMLLVLTILAAVVPARPQITGPAHPAGKVILDTDIGDDIDDAYALALLLKSPQIKIVGITTAFGDTHLRARLVSRFLSVTGNAAIPVFAGPPTKVKNGLSQKAWAMQSPDRAYPDAIAFMLETIRKNPGQITLISIAPLTNIGPLIERDPATFRKLKRVVMMGGSIYRGYGDEHGGHPEPEWNILSDIPAAKALFASGVPLYVMPLDSTQIDLDIERQKSLFGHNTALTSALEQLTREWSAASHRSDPTLFDPMAAAYALRPELCPTTPMRIVVDDRGMTRPIEGKPNANICLRSSSKQFFNFYMPRLVR